MALGILRGPVFAGKSQWLRDNLEPDQVVADYSDIYHTIAGVQRDPVTGRFPPRTSNDARLALARAVQIIVIQQAAERGLEGWATTSSSAPEAVEQLREWGATAAVVTIDPGEAIVRQRLAEYVADAGGGSECSRAINRWYS